MSQKIFYYFKKTHEPMFLIKGRILLISNENTDTEESIQKYWWHF